MGINNIWVDWLTEAEEPVAGQAPTTDPQAMVTGAAGVPPGVPPADPAPPQQQQPPQQQPQDNVEDDPQIPDQQQDDSPKDFEQWRHDFLELSVKSDVGEMLSSIGQVRNHQGLESSQKKFIEDNLQILLYRQDANVSKATKEIRNLIKEDLDRTNPGTTVMQHLTSILEQDVILSQVLLKLPGLYGMKSDLHRKYIAALLGAIQVGGGGNREDLLYTDKEYTINFSTRFHTQFGEITLGKWSLKSDDPQRYLTEPEIDRLQEGSPEEKQVLRRRVIIESIGEKFKHRAFIIHITESDNTIFSLGWDLGDSLLSAYKEGKLVVRGKQNKEKDAMISDTGEIITLIDLDILYVMETGQTDDDGAPEMTEVPFMQRRDSVLYLNADLQTLQAAASGVSGLFFRETPYNGNPSDGDATRRCIPSLVEILNKRCAK